MKTAALEPHAKPSLKKRLTQQRKGREARALSSSRLGNNADPKKAAGGNPGSRGQDPASAPRRPPLSPAAAGCSSCALTSLVFSDRRRFQPQQQMTSEGRHSVRLSPSRGLLKTATAGSQGLFHPCCPRKWDFPGGSAGKNVPANAGDI